jgi:hypothetical protein
VGYTQQRQILSKKKNGKGKILKIFINSENLRGRRPVTCQTAGKDPRPSGEACLYFLPEAISLSPIVKTDDVVSERKYIRSGNDNSQQHIKSIKKPPANQ